MRLLGVACLSMITWLSFGQDVKKFKGEMDQEYARTIVDKLADPSMLGRGYIGKGDSIAAEYLRGEFKGLKIQPLGNEYYQDYNIPINTFPFEPSVSIDGQKYECAKDYIVDPSSCSVKGTFPIVWLTAKEMLNQEALYHFMQKDLSNSFISIDSTGLGKEKKLYDFAYMMLSKNRFGAKGVIVPTSSLIFSARTYQSDFAVVKMKKENLTEKKKSITIDLQNHFIESYKTQNIGGFIKGKSDSTVLLVAHYDHLGKLGNHIYPGALDNASGVSMVLSMAKYFKKHKPKYNIAILLVSGEECGLEGSKYFVKHPLLDLKQVKQIINFDMVGSGEKGLYVFNGQENKRLMSFLIPLNDEHKYISEIHNQIATTSSDHASFHENGYLAVGFYTDGDISHYHRPSDYANTVTLYAFQGMFKLLASYLTY